MKKITATVFGFLATLPVVFAHCPLCTVGAAAAGGVAAYLGVSHAVIGIFIGAFAVAVGAWFGRLIKKKFHNFPIWIAIALSFVTTVFPIAAILPEYTGLYIAWLGDYGKTFTINLFIITSMIGGGVLLLAPRVSKEISKMREGKMIPYQGMIISFSTLIVLSIVIQVMV